MYAKSATTIANILEAAQSLFISKNYADVTMSDIASLAQVTKGALYHHFDSKDALYLTMMHNFLEELRELAKTAVDLKGSCQDRMQHLVNIFVKLSEEEKQLLKLVRRDVNIFTGQVREQLVRAYQAALPNQIELIIRDGIRDGELEETDPRLLAWEHVAMVEVVLSPYAQRVLGGHKQTVEYVLGLFFNGASRKSKPGAQISKKLKLEETLG